MFELKDLLSIKKAVLYKASELPKGASLEALREDAARSEQLSHSHGSDGFRYWQSAASFLWASEYIRAHEMTLSYQGALDELKSLGGDRFYWDTEGLFRAVGWSEGYVYTRSSQDAWDRFRAETLPGLIKRFETFATECPDVIACERGSGASYRAWFTRWQTWPDSLGS